MIGVLESGGQHASAASVRMLEVAHKKQFSRLIDAWDKYHKGYRDLYLPNGQYNPESKFSPTRLSAYAQRLLPLTSKWRARQLRLEAIPNSNTQIVSFPLSSQSFVTPSGFALLKQARDRMDKEKQAQGVGFIPLIIWAIIAIVTAFTAVEVTDELNNTSEEQAELVKETNDFCSSQNLTADECNKLLTEQTAVVTETTTGSIFKWVAILGGGFLAVKFLSPEIKKRYGKKTETATT